MWVETTSLRACGAAFVCAAEAGLACDICGGDWTLSLRSWEVRWPDWINGPVTLPVSRVCDTVVICARRGSEIVAGLIDRDSRSVLRAERASDAMVVLCNGRLRHFLVESRIERPTYVPSRARANFWCGGKFAATSQLHFQVEDTVHRQHASERVYRALAEAVRLNSHTLSGGLIFEKTSPF